MKSISLIASTAVLTLSMGCGNSASGPNGTNTTDTTERTDISSCFGQPSPNATVFGAWNAQLTHVDENNVRVPVDATITIYSSGKINYTVTCNYPTSQLTASVEVSATVTADEIIYNEASHNTATDGKERCTATIEPHRVSYALVGNCLRFNNGKPSILVRN